MNNENILYDGGLHRDPYSARISNTVDACYFELTRDHASSNGFRYRGIEISRVKLHLYTSPRPGTWLKFEISRVKF